MKKQSKYRRCKKCKELVLDPDNCANCANHDPLSLTRRSDRGDRKVPSLTLDQQEGNSEEYF